MVKMWRNISTFLHCQQKCNLVKQQAVFIIYKCGGSDGKESTCNAEGPGWIPGLGRYTWRRGSILPTLLLISLQYSWASLVVQLVKNPPAMWKTCVQSMSEEKPLKKGKATHSSILAYRIPYLYSLWGVQSMRLQRVGHG